VKRFALLLFAGLFGFATLQTASAQGNHNVTISVDESETISVDGSPTVDIGSTIDEWVSGNGNGTYSVTTNASDDRKITVTASADGLGSGNVGALGLRVDANATPGGGTQQGSSDGALLLTDTGEGSFVDDTDFITGFKDVDTGDLGLTYEAKATADFDPSNDGAVKITYTLTSDGGGN